MLGLVAGSWNPAMIQGGSEENRGGASNVAVAYRSLRRPAYLSDENVSYRSLTQISDN